MPPHALPGQALLLGGAAQGIQVSSLHVGGCLHIVGVRYQIRETCRRDTQPGGLQADRQMDRQMQQWWCLQFLQPLQREAGARASCRASPSSQHLHVPTVPLGPPARRPQKCLWIWPSKGCSTRMGGGALSRCSMPLFLSLQSSAKQSLALHSDNAWPLTFL